MSIDLNSLVDAGGTTLEDLVSPVDTADMPINNESTANDLASHAALLTEPDMAVDNYRTMMGEFASNEGSPTLDKIIMAANKRENELSIQQMGEILGDDTIPLDRKVGYASLWRTGFVAPQEERSPQELVAVNQLEKEGVITDNQEVDDTRWDLAGKLKEVNAYNETIQKMINEAEIAEDPSLTDKIIDIAESIVPFTESPNVYDVNKGMRKLLDENNDPAGKATAMIQSLFQMGESKEEIRARIAKVPLDQRMKLAQAVYDLVIQSNKSIAGGKNSLMMMNNLRQYLVDGEYTTSDRIIDDLTGIVDAIGLGAGIKLLKTGLRGQAEAARFTRRSPVSVGDTVAQTNAKSANELIRIAADDTSGEAAKRIYGTDRDDAIINTLGPEIGLSDDSVRMKPLIDDDQFDPDYAAVRQITGRDGSIQFSDEEKLSKLQRVTDDFTNTDITGLVAHKEMTSIKAVDDGVNVRTIFGPAEGGFSDPIEAINQVKLATRKYGITDDEIVVLRQDSNGNYSKVDANLEYAKDQAAGRKGNYVVGINHTTAYDPSDTISWSVTDVKGTFLGIPLNIFDKLPIYLKGKGGSITQHLIPPQSYIDPLLTRSASVTADQAAHASNLLLNTGNEWATKYKGLKGHQRKVIDNYILEANHKSLKFDPAKLRADGWTEEMLSAFRSWKKTNDTLFVLENTDLVRQSKRKGFQMFVTGDGQDQFLVKPIANSTVGNMQGFKGKAYDPELGLIRNINGQERKELYKNGGTIAIARTPVNVGEDSIPYVIVKQNSNAYTRGLRESDALLNYRDGHFTIYYKNPVFITKEVKNADGSTYTKAIATAANIKDAEGYMARLSRTDPKGKYEMRSDRVGEELEEMLWNARVNAGRTAQRTRGEMLRDVTDRPTDLGFRHIATPEESLVRSINSISRRINYKEYLDVAKKRYMQQYKDFLPVDPQTHAKIWPDSVKDLKKPSLGGDSKAFSDAVSTYRYIDQMESGFINILDDTSKNFFKAIAETSGKKGFTFMENLARKAEDTSPTAYARKKAFRFLLAANPLRQIVVQASQAFPVISATNPRFLLKLPWQLTFTRYLDRGGDLESFFKAAGHKLTGLSVEEARALEKAYKNSGISSAVSAHSLIRDDLKSLVSRGAVQKLGAVAGKPIDVMQKMGFEAGENMLMRSVWLSEYDVLKRSGKKIDAASLALLHARVRDLTLNMNKAGELAYNENAASAFMQFAQAPHKALAQILAGNRGLSKKDRIALGTSYLLTYGTGYGLLYEQASKLLPAEDRELHDIVSGGLFNAAMNRTLTTLYGEEVNTDFSSSMRLLEIPHLTDMWEAMATMDLETIVTQSPSVSLVYGDNARLGNLAKSMYRFFTVPEDDGNLKDVGTNFLTIFSGASNIFKARYAFQRGYSISTKGEVTDPNVNEVEAMMKILGFQTVDEMLSYEVNGDLYFNSKAFKDDVKYLMDETTRRLGREGISEQESEYVIRMWREANRVFDKNPAALQVVQSEISRRIKSGDHIILNRLIEQIPMTTESQFMEALSKAPIDENNKRELMKIYNFMKEPE